MFQTKMYVRELLDFLNTVTIKNEMVADHMLSTWVNDFYRDDVKDNPKLNPYYRNLMGDYVLKDLSAIEPLLGIDRSTMSMSEYKDMQPYIADQALIRFGLSDKTVINGRTFSNRDIYTRFNDLVILPSMDTQEDIPLTRKVMASLTHVKTIASYKIPSVNFYTLCDRHPNNSALIKAILYPIPDKLDRYGLFEKSAMDFIIDSPNLALLHSDLNVLEENEKISMVECLHNTLSYISTRWFVKEFAFEDLYPAAHEAVMWNMLFLALNVQRIKNIKTHAAHSYHVWEYIKSHGFDDYRTFLTREQTIFLYKNLPYLLKRKGTERVLELLSYVLLHPWNIRLNNKVITQQTQDSFNEKDPYNETTTPIVNATSNRIGESMFGKLNELTIDAGNITKAAYSMSYQDLLVELEKVAGTHVDLNINAYELTQYEALKTLFEKERKAELEHQDDDLFQRSISAQNKRFSTTPHNLLKTKLLEIISPVHSLVFETLYARFITQQIYYRSSTNSLRFAITFMPTVTDMFITMTADEALALMLYAILKEKGFEPEYPPDRAMITLAYKKEYDIREGLPTTFPTCHGYKYTKSILKPVVNAYAIFVKDSPGLDGTYIPTTSNNIWTRSTSSNVNSLSGMFTTHTADIKTIIKNVNTTLDKIWRPDEIKSFYHTGRITSYVNQVFENVENPAIVAKMIVERLYDSSGELIGDEAIFQYNSKHKRWEFTKNNQVVMYSPFISYHVNNIFSSGVAWDFPNFWYDSRHKRTPSQVAKVLNPNINDHYVINHEINTHPTAYSSVEAFSTSIHNQGTNFVSMMAEAGIPASNLQSDFLSNTFRCNGNNDDPLQVNDVVSLNLLNGQSYKRYFATDPVLLSLISNINLSKSPKEGYAKLSNAILESLYPINDPIKRDADYIVNTRYRKLKELFVSMCSYNVAFLETENINAVPYTMRVTTAQTTKVDINRQYYISMLDGTTKHTKDHRPVWNDMNNIVVREYLN